MSVVYVVRYNSIEFKDHIDMITADYDKAVKRIYELLVECREHDKAWGSIHESELKYSDNGKVCGIYKKHLEVKGWKHLIYSVDEYVLDKCYPQVVK